MKTPTLKHTPAPWGIQTAGGEPHQPLHVTDASGDAICRVQGMKFDGGWSSQTQANAQLIAAAPELLAMLQALGAAVENGDPQEIADIWGQASAAVARATGESLKAQTPA